MTDITIVSVRRLTPENWNAVLEWADMSDAEARERGFVLGDWLNKADDGQIYRTTNEQMEFVRKSVGDLKNRN